MLTLTVAVPSTRRPLNVGSGSTKRGIDVPASGVCGTVADSPLTPTAAPMLIGSAAGSSGLVAADREGRGPQAYPQHRPHVQPSSRHLALPYLSRLGG